MPKAYKKRASVVVLAASIAAAKLVADFIPMRSSIVIIEAVSLNRSAGLWTSSLSINCSTTLSPMPSISKALRDAKCLIASLRCASQNKPPLQRATASPSRRSTKLPHTGQLCGNTMSVAVSGRLSGTMATICGITSPARRMITVSPTLMPKRAISLALCSVAFDTVTPPTNTGFKRATGVTAPVRPTWKSTPSSRVISSCAGNL